MKYAILIYETPTDFESRDHTDRQEKYWGAYQAYVQALQDAGVLATGGGALLPPQTGTAVRLSGAERRVQDGPYAETKEQLGGLIVIDVPDLDRALEWAARCPAASSGAVEVRPLLPPMA